MDQGDRWLTKQSRVRYQTSVDGSPATDHGGNDLTEDRDSFRTQQQQQLSSSASKRHQRQNGTLPVADRDISQQRADYEPLYEAYEELRCLALQFGLPFHAPAILVTGHQTDGKSGEVRAGSHALARSPSLLHRDTLANIQPDSI